MEPNNFIDNIKTEKAHALARYRTFTNITKLFQVFELFLAVAFISWSSSHLPSVFKLSGEYVTSLSSYFMNQHVVFLIGNVIVVVCYVLSRYSDSGNDSVSYESRYFDGNCNGNGNGNCNFTNRKISSDATMTSSKPLEIQTPVILNSKSELEVAVNGNGDGKGKFIRRKTASDASMTSAKPLEIQSPVNLNNICRKTASDALMTSAKRSEIQCQSPVNLSNISERFQRTRSEKVKRQVPVKSDRELRRSMTEMRRSVAVSSGGREAVEKLSNEEFRVAVETFILKQQRFLKQQSIVEDDGSC